MDTGDSSNDGNPRRRNRRGRRGAASHPPATGDGRRRPARRVYGVDTLHNRIVGPLTYREALHPSIWGPPEEPTEQSRLGRLPRPSPAAPVHDDAPYSSSWLWDDESGTSAARSDHSGTEGAVTRTRVRQSVMYSNRPRRPRRRQEPLPTQDHPSEVDSSELGRTVADLRPLEALSLSDLQPSTRRQTSSSAAPPVETKECPSEVKSTDLSIAVTDLPTLEVLSLMNELPHFIPDEIFIPREYFIPDKTSEDTDDDDADEEHHSDACNSLGNLSSIETISASDTQAPPAEFDYGYDELSRVGPGGRTILFFNQPKGISRSMLLADTLLVTVPDDEEQPKSDSDVDSVESESDMEESERPCATFREFFDRIIAVEQATLSARAAECGTELPSAIIAQAAVETPRQQETWSLPTPQQDSTAAIQRHEDSTEDIVRRGKKWMSEEVMLCFRKYIERRPDLVGLEYKLDELCHQCFNVDSYNKVFHHYNFRVMMKMPSSVNWTMELYFAEVKQIFGRKYYFCCALEQDEDGDCYACKNQGVKDLKHPVTGGYDTGSPDTQFSLW